MIGTTDLLVTNFDVFYVFICTELQSGIIAYQKLLEHL